MKYPGLLLLVTLLCGIPQDFAWADPPQPRLDTPGQAFTRPDWRQLSPEERYRLRKQMHEEWDRLSPEEQLAHKRARKERKEALKQYCKSEENNAVKSSECLRWEQHHSKDASREKREDLREELLRQYYKLEKHDR